LGFCILGLDGFIHTTNEMCEILACENFTAQPTVTNDDGIRAKRIISEQSKQDRPFYQFAINLHPRWAARASESWFGDHVAQFPQMFHAKKFHQAAQWRYASGFIWLKLSLT